AQPGAAWHGVRLTAAARGRHGFGCAERKRPGSCHSPPGSVLQKHRPDVVAKVAAWLARVVRTGSVDPYHVAKGCSKGIGRPYPRRRLFLVPPSAGSGFVPGVGARRLAATPTKNTLAISIAGVLAAGRSLPNPRRSSSCVSARS